MTDELEQPESPAEPDPTGTTQEDSPFVVPELVRVAAYIAPAGPRGTFSLGDEGEGLLTWEYKVFGEYWRPGEDDAFLHALNTLGSEGWELVQALPTPEEDMEHLVRLVFKRLVVSQSEGE
jgi:hypothetical protein